MNNVIKNSGDLLQHLKVEIAPHISRYILKFCITTDQFTVVQSVLETFNDFINEQLEYFKDVELFKFVQRTDFKGIETEQFEGDNVSDLHDYLEAQIDKLLKNHVAKIKSKDPHYAKSPLVQIEALIIELNERKYKLKRRERNTSMYDDKCFIGGQISELEQLVYELEMFITTLRDGE